VNPSLNLYLTPAELARLYKVSRRTVKRWNAHGDIRFLKVGQSVRYALDAVLEFELRHTIASRWGTDSQQVQQQRARLEWLALELTKQRQAAA